VKAPWRDDPDLVRQADEEDLQRVELQPRWQRLFEMIEVMFVGEGLSWKDKTQRTVLRGFLWQSKKKVAVDPDGARAYVIDAMYGIAAALEIEPHELFKDLKPKEPAVVT
jgi:hypothetical protein